MTFAGAPKRSNWGSRGFSYHLFFLSALESSLAKGRSFLPLFPVSVVADIRIQLVSENLNADQILGCGILWAHWACQSIHQMGGTQGDGSWSSKEEQKPIYHPRIAPTLVLMSASMESGKWFWLPFCHSAYQQGPNSQPY